MFICLWSAPACSTMKFLAVLLFVCGACSATEYSDRKKTERSRACKDYKIDTVLMLDGSKHMGEYDFQILIKRLIHATTMTTISPDATRVGIIEIGNRGYKVLELGAAKNLSDTLDVLLTMEYNGEQNHNIVEAMELMIDMFERSGRKSPGVHKVATLATTLDVHDWDRILELGEKTKRMGIKLTVTTRHGDAEDKENFQKLASSPKLAIFAEDEEEHMRKVHEVLDDERDCELLFGEN